jgi:hypothetical protein
MNCHSERIEGPVYTLELHIPCSPRGEQGRRSRVRRPGPTTLRRLLASIAVIFILVGPRLTLQAQNKTAAPGKPAPPHTTDDPQVYRNTTLGFRYQIPYGWVNRSKEMQEGNEGAKGGVLLAVFERPPEATGDTVNSAIVIASESAATYPGLKTAEDYLGPLRELATSNGFKADGEPSTLEIDSRQLARADFIKPISKELSMRQCTLVLLMKGQIISFTVIGGSEDEIDALVDGLHFGAAKPMSR